MADANADNASGTLKEIVVTAQRRQQRLQDVPITITYLSSNALADADVQDLEGIQKLTPALRFDNNATFVQATIRGIGTSVVNIGGGENVGIYVDGFYSPNPTAADFQLLNVDNVQILKGPQGTLFGRNTTGGAILVTTAKPSETTSAILDASYGSFNAQRYQGYFTTGLTDRIAMDIAGEVTQGDGFYTNVVDNDNDTAKYTDWSLRLGLEAHISDNISELFRYSHQSTNDPTSVEGEDYVQNGQPLALDSIIPGEIIATKPSEVAYNPSKPPQATGNNDVFQLTSTIDLDFGTLTSYTQYRDEKSIYWSGDEVVPLFRQSIQVPDTTITQEFLLTSKPGGRLQWTAGAFYLDYTDAFNVFLSLAGGPVFAYPGGFLPVDTVELAGYGDATYQLTDNFYITAGVRYGHDEVNDVRQKLSAGGIQQYPDLSGNRATPRVVLRYTPSENSSIYASFTRGYKAAIYDLGGVYNAPVKPETVSAYEIGYKYARPALSYDLASFYYDYTNMQVSTYGVSPITNTPVAQITNAASARIYGFEADARYEIFRGFEVNADAAYTNAKYTKWVGAPYFTPCFSVSACGANYGSNVQGTINASGLELQRAPPFTATVGARYNMELAGGVFTLSGNLYYSSRLYFDAVDEISQPSYETLGLRAEWTNPSGRYNLAVYGDNVTNNRYLTSGQTGNTGFLVRYSAPATVGGEVRVRFQ